MRIKFEKCNGCRYKNKRKDIFPCGDCKGNPPVTCDDCRTRWFHTCKKGIRPCKHFEWS